MTQGSGSASALSVQILASSTETATDAVKILREAALPYQIFEKSEDLLQALEASPGVLLFVENVLDEDLLKKLRVRLANQAAWSDIPVIVTRKIFASESTKPTPCQILTALNNVTILEGSLTFITLLSVVRTALAARKKQLEIRNLIERERAIRQTVEQTSRIKDEFLATLSHELQTPLNAIVGYSELLPLEDPNSPAFSEAIEQINRNAHIQSQLINDILDLSNIITGKLGLRVEPVCIKELVNDVIRGFRCAAKAKSLCLHVDLDEAKSILLADASRLRQVIWNLFSNAIKFTPEHGHIWISLREEDEHQRLTISDTGKGIEHEFLPFVFDLFRQQEAGFNRTFGGLGLGLSIVRHLVEAHGGEVHAQSRGRGEGASFTIVLPVLHKESSAPLLYESLQKSDDHDAGFTLY